MGGMAFLGACVCWDNFRKPLDLPLKLYHFHPASTNERVPSGDCGNSQPWDIRGCDFGRHLAKLQVTGQIRKDLVFNSGQLLVVPPPSRRSKRDAL